MPSIALGSVFNRVIGNSKLGSQNILETYLGVTDHYISRNGRMSESGRVINSTFRNSRTRRFQAAGNNQLSIELFSLPPSSKSALDISTIAELQELTNEPEVIQTAVQPRSIDLRESLSEWYVMLLSYVENRKQIQKICAFLLKSHLNKHNCNAQKIPATYSGVADLFYSEMAEWTSRVRCLSQHFKIEGPNGSQLLATINFW